MTEKHDNAKDAPVEQRVRRFWPPRDEVDGETESLIWIVNHGWCWNWPGWKWVANRLNNEFKNSRTSEACRKKYTSLQNDA